MSAVRTLCVVAVGVVVSCIVSFTTSPVEANWSGATGVAGNSETDGTACINQVNMTDNKDIGIYYPSSGSPDLVNATNWVRTQLLNPTAIDTSLAAAHTEVTDVVVSDAYYTSICEQDVGMKWTPAGNLIGLEQCEVALANGRCGHAIVRISRYILDSYNNDGDRLVACHEVGHAIGLTHRPTGDGCIQESPLLGSTYYTPHDLAHFNDPW
jgi:hypothetical protein